MAAEADLARGARDEDVWLQIAVEVGDGEILDIGLAVVVEGIGVGVGQGLACAVRQGVLGVSACAEDDESGRRLVVDTALLDDAQAVSTAQVGDRGRVDEGLVGQLTEQGIDAQAIAARRVRQQQVQSSVSIPVEPHGHPPSTQGIAQAEGLGALHQDAIVVPEHLCRAPHRSATAEGSSGDDQIGIAIESAQPRLTTRSRFQVIPAALLTSSKRGAPGGDLRG